MANFEGNNQSAPSVDDVRALLSPSSSRYAFSAVETTLANLSLTDIDDLPALEPETQAALEAFTTELNRFNSWITGLSLDQQRTSISLFIDSIKDMDTIDFIASKVNTIKTNSQMPLSPQLAPSIRPMSPLLSTGLENNHHNHKNPHTNSHNNNNSNTHNTTLDSLISSPIPVNYPQPISGRAMLSPLMRPSNGFNSMNNNSNSKNHQYHHYMQQQQQPSRPRSAGPRHDMYSMMSPMDDQEATSQFGFVSMTAPQPQSSDGVGTNVMSELLPQPLVKVLSDAGPDVDQRGRNGGFSKVLRSNYSGGNNSSSMPPPINRGKTVNSGLPSSLLQQPVTNLHQQNQQNQPLQQQPNKDIISEELLNNIPQWLKALRLHKYTDNLKDLQWREMVDLDDTDLQKLGISTVGARNKLLKSFSQVKEHFLMP